MRTWFLICLLAPLGAAADMPAVHTEKARATPDFCQQDKDGRFENGGGTYCAPVAVSNGLMCLGQRGFPKLCPPAATTKESQIKLIHTLAARDYMDADDGAGPPGVARGIKKYVTGAGYRIARLEYQGWRRGPRDAPPLDDTPQLDWLKAGVADPHGAVFLNIGWYTQEPGSKDFKRLGGHWMTVVGYGVDAQGRKDPRVLLIHDPALRTGLAPKTQHVRLEELKSGQLTGGERGLPRPAAGFYSLREGMVIKKSVQAAILDAAVVLVLAKE